MKTRFLIALIAGVFFWSTASAGIEQYSTRVEGTDISTSNPFEVEDARYFDMTINPAWELDFTNYRVNNFVQLGVNPEVVQDASFTGSIDVRVTYDVWNNGIFASQTADRTLSVSYDINGNAIIDDLSTFTFQNGHAIKVEVLAINGLDVNDVFLESRIEVERYYAFDGGQVAGSGYIDAGNGYLDFFWETKTGAEYYELEWVHINDYTFQQGTYIPAANLNFDFYLNSTRIVTSKNWYRIPKIFDHGYMLFRIRPIGVQGTNFDIRHDGQWNAADNGVVSSFTPNQLITIGTEYDTDMNWSHQVGYTEEGKRFESVGYMDGLGRGRQTVAHNTDTRQAVISNVYYDELGRPAVSDLPTPEDGENLVHHPNFNRAEADPSQSYQAQFFDDPGSTFCDPLGVGFDTGQGAGQYYSSQNPDKDGENAHIPDAEKFPFSRVTYLNDYTNRPRRVSGFGDDLRIGSGHETQYFYPSTNQWELDRLFGSEVGYYTHYQKMITVDPNGQVYAQYMDMAGRVVMSYMLGESPTNLNSLSNNQGTQQTVDIIKNGQTQTIDNDPPSSTVTYAEYFADGGTYDFNYSFTPQQYNGSCLPANICFDCVYDLTLLIRDECGAEIFSNTTQINGGAFDAVCNGATNHTLTQQLILNKGMYVIEKSLTVNQAAIDEYWCFYIDNETCIDPLENRFNLLYANEPFADCNIEPINTGDTPCAIAENAMLQDVSPGGQYALYTVTNGVYTSGDATSIFENNAHQGYTYTVDGIPGGTPITVLFNGQQVSPATLSIEDFVLLFDASWAPSLVQQHHPEICYLDFCGQLSASETFDQNLLGTNDFDIANGAGYFDPLGTLLSGTSNVNGVTNTGTTGINPTTAGNVDPFFTTAVGSAYLSQMTGELDNYITLDDNGTPVQLTMWQYAIYLTMQDLCNSTTIAGCIAEWRKEDDCNNDLVWLNFRALYIQSKANYVYQAQQAYVNSASCTVGNNDCIGSGAVGCEDYANKVPRFVNPTLQIAGTQVGNINAGNAQTVFNQQVATACQQMADQLAAEWVSLLTGCDYVGNSVNTTNLQTDFATFIAAGCDQNHPQGASTVPAGTMITLVSGAQITDPTINDILADHISGFSENNLCTELLISTPPYAAASVVLSALERPIDTCGCNNLYEAQTLVLASSGTLTLEAALEQLTGVSVDDADYWLCACDEASGGYSNWLTNGWDNPTLPPFSQLPNTTVTIPIGLACEECNVTCAQITTDQQTLDTRFTGVTNFTEAANYETILTNYLNNTYGYSLVYEDYQVFIDKCAATVADPYCEVNPLMDDWAAMMTLIAYRGQLLNDNQNQVALATDNIVYANSDLQNAFSEGYWGEVVGNTLTMHTGNCDFTITETGFDFSSIIGFGAILPLSENCPGTANNSFQVEVTYIDCGERKTANLTATSTCFEVNECICDPTGITLCDRPFEVFEGPCYQPRLDELYQTAWEDYEQDIAQAYLDFTAEYNAQCAAAFATENLNYDGTIRTYQYTLFYYDQAGNLVRTVAPEGITPLNDTQTAQAATARDNVTNSQSTGAVLPTHDYQTTYNYNSYNQLAETTNPDQEGDTKFWYDRYGRIAASQNPTQATENKYSFTCYDKQGRPFKVGQVVQTTAPSEADLKLDDLGVAFLAWINAGTTSEITLTQYDRPLGPTIEALFENGQQENLRLRVASVLYYAVEGPLDSYESATHYSYDLHGNVKEQIQDVPALQPVEQDIKSTAYEYDLISGNVNTVAYQKGENDYLEHAYCYDELNRLTEVFTSTDLSATGTAMHKTREAHYFYYDYGPMARTELGQYKVQGCDYVYTINGWLKGLNASTLNTARDMGKDAYFGYLNGNGGVHSLVAKDVNAYTIGYFSGDYTAIDPTSTMEMTSAAGDAFEQQANDLYNGNIRHLVTSIHGMQVMGTVYSYDQLQRLTEMTAFYNTNTDHTWTGMAATQEYYNAYKYDRNGNIQTLQRNGTIASGLLMDQFTYNYTTVQGQLSNRLDFVNDTGADDGTSTAGDIKAGMSASNYQYDEIGELLGDVSEDIIAMEWRRGDKKLKAIRRGGVTGASDVEFIYNPFGIRVVKIEKPRSGPGNLAVLPPEQWKYTYYAHDANGQCMAVYDVKMSPTNNQAFISEHHLYGSSRIGMLKENELLFDNGNTLPQEDDVIENTLGLRRYELTNHLGNVQAVITDRKIPAETEAVDFNNLVTTGVCGTAGTWTFTGTGPIVTTNVGDFDGDGDTDLDMSNASATSYSSVLNIAVQPGAQYTLNYNIDAINANFLNTLVTECPSPQTFPVNAINVTPGSYSYTFTAPNPLPSNLMRITFFIGSSGGASNVTISNLSLEGPGQILGGNGADLACYEAVVVMTSDYYPFGQVMPDRQNTNIQSGEQYRFNYNSMESDPEVSGNGNSYTTEFRQYDPRLGRWKSLDPLMAQFPWMSPYVGFDNNPVLFIDPLGLAVEGWIIGEGDDKTPRYDPNVNSQADAPDGFVYVGEEYWYPTASGEMVHLMKGGSYAVHSALPSEHVDVEPENWASDWLEMNRASAEVWGDAMISTGEMVRSPGLFFIGIYDQLSMLDATLAMAVGMDNRQDMLFSTNYEKKAQDNFNAFTNRVKGVIEGDPTAIGTTLGEVSLTATTAVVPELVTVGSAGEAIIVSESSIEKALRGSNMKTTQGRVSLPMIKRYVEKLQNGEVAPPIKVTNDGIIIDGNHRYIAGKLFGTEPPTVPGTLSPSQRNRVVPIQKTKVDPTDWGGQ